MYDNVLAFLLKSVQNRCKPDTCVASALHQTKLNADGIRSSIEGFLRAESASPYDGRLELPSLVHSHLVEGACNGGVIDRRTSAQIVDRAAEWTENTLRVRVPANFLGEPELCNELAYKLGWFLFTRSYMSSVVDAGHARRHSLWPQAAAQIIDTRCALDESAPMLVRDLDRLFEVARKQLELPSRWVELETESHLVSTLERHRALLQRCVRIAEHRTRYCIARSAALAAPQRFAVYLAECNFRYQVLNKLTVRLVGAA